MIDTLLAMDPALIATFVAAGVLLNLTPGSDVGFAMASGASGGAQAGLMAAVGITLGGLTHVALAALGISAALMAVPHAYDIIRYVGAAYLLFLAIRTWRAPSRLRQADGARRLWSALRRGFLTNILNPKVALFVLAFLPQFTRAEAGPIWQQIVILGVLFNLSGLVINGGYGVAAGLVRERLTRVGGALNKLTSIIFGGLAVRLIWE